MKEDKGGGIQIRGSEKFMQNIGQRIKKYQTTWKT
jgi:hypothetical protein